jgi:hypothetical protein
MRIGIRHSTYLLLGIDEVLRLDQEGHSYIKSFIRAMDVDDSLMELLAVVTNSYVHPKYPRTIALRK